VKTLEEYQSHWAMLEQARGLNLVVTDEGHIFYPPDPSKEQRDAIHDKLRDQIANSGDC